MGQRVLAVLALIAAVTPFATDPYLPAFPVMISEIATSATTTQSTLAPLLIGIT